jgi:group I intron endonuclease
VYIGITGQNPSKRWGNGTNYGHNEHFKKAIKKYGWENFKHEILASGLTRDEAEQIEICEIKRHKSNERECGYNITNGGEKIGKFTAESKAKISGSKKGTPAWNKGIPLSDEQKAKMSKALKGRVSPRKGAKCTDEQRKRMSDAHLGCVNVNRKKVIDIDTGEVFDSIHDAANKTGANVQNISAVCNGKFNKTHGRRFRFA